jgi:uncharacterized Ntn-hydrolase superfamily protein
MPAIVGRDPATGDLGVAVAQKIVAYGALAPWAQVGVGAVATLGRIINTSYGPRALRLLANGRSPQEVIQLLTRDDERPTQRQIALVDAHGRAAVFTGSGVMSSKDGWAGGFQRLNVAVAGSRLNDESTLVAMADTFERTTGPLWERLIAALDAGLTAGGDIRTRKQHSSALLVVRKGAGRGGFDDRMIDLRVDDHPRPVDELYRLLAIHHRLFLPCDPSKLVPVTRQLARALQARLAFIGDYEGSVNGVYDAATREAVARFAARENLEEHVRADERIDPRVLEHLDVRVG